MKFSFASLISIFIFLVISACSSPSTQTDAKAVGDWEGPLEFKSQSISKTYGDCKDQGKPCARVDFIYPEPSGANELVRNNIQAITVGAFENMLQEITENDTDDPSLEVLIDKFFSQYEEFIEVVPESSQQWDIKVKSNNIYQQENLVSFIFGANSYTGGAHSNDQVYYTSLDLPTGKKLNLIDLVTDPKAVTAIGEKVFREQEGLAMDLEWGQSSFHFPDQRFYLPANVALIEEGLLFYYNSYEIESYAYGPTQLTISRESLGELLKY